jgi:hypothetical protein
MPQPETYDETRAANEGGNWGPTARWFIFALLAIGFIVCLYALRWGTP